MPLTPKHTLLNPSPHGSGNYRAAEVPLIPHARTRRIKCTNKLQVQADRHEIGGQDALDVACPILLEKQSCCSPAAQCFR